MTTLSKLTVTLNGIEHLMAMSVVAKHLPQIKRVETTQESRPLIGSVSLPTTSARLCLFPAQGVCQSWSRLLRYPPLPWVLVCRQHHRDSSIPTVSVVTMASYSALLSLSPKNTKIPEKSPTKTCLTSTLGLTGTFQCLTRAKVQRAQRVVAMFDSVDEALMTVASCLLFRALAFGAPLYGARQVLQEVYQS
jgi:hypothetical protein